MPGSRPPARLRAHLTALALALAAAAAQPLQAQLVSGVPDPLLSPAYPHLSFQTTNDNFGSSFGDEWDDLRTFGFHLQTWFLEDYCAMISYSGFTNRDKDDERGRIDEMTITLGRTLLFAGGVGLGGSLVAGGGARVYGDLLGEEIQMGWHGLFEVHRSVDLPYESYSAWSGVVYAAARGRYRRVEQPSEVIFLFPPGQAEWALAGRVLVSTAGEVEGSADVEWLLISGRTQTLIGLKYRDSALPEESVTLQKTSRYESGFWLRHGTSVGPFFSEFTYQLTTGIGSGAFGLEFGRSDARMHPPMTADMTNEFGVCVVSYSLINQIRWHPAVFDTGGWVPRRLWLTLDYRSGKGPLYRWPDYIVKTDQYTAGVSLTLFPLETGFQINPMIGVSVGLRNEGLFEQTRRRTHAEDRVFYPVLQGELGMRMNLGNLFGSDERTVYSVGFAVDGYMQFPGLRSRPDRFYTTSAAIGADFSLRASVTAVR